MYAWSLSSYLETPRRLFMSKHEPFREVRNVQFCTVWRVFYCDMLKKTQSFADDPFHAGCCYSHHSFPCSSFPCCDMKPRGWGCRLCEQRETKIRGLQENDKMPSKEWLGGLNLDPHTDSNVFLNYLLKGGRNLQCWFTFSVKTWTDL